MARPAPYDNFGCTHILPDGSHCAKLASYVPDIYGPGQFPAEGWSGEAFCEAHVETAQALERAEAQVEAISEDDEARRILERWETPGAVMSLAAQMPALAAYARRLEQQVAERDARIAAARTHIERVRDEIGGARCNHPTAYIAACDRCEPDRRPRMFVCDYHEGWLAAAEDLIPPPGNWRLTVTEDGTVEGRVRLWRPSVLTGAWYDDEEETRD